jgi:hypothetical protein
MTWPLRTPWRPPPPKGRARRSVPLQVPGNRARSSVPLKLQCIIRSAVGGVEELEERAFLAVGGADTGAVRDELGRTAEAIEQRANA